jgi:hypothetical protein
VDPRGGLDLTETDPAVLPTVQQLYPVKYLGSTPKWYIRDYIRDITVFPSSCLTLTFSGTKAVRSNSFQHILFFFFA